ncbi:MAG: Peptidase [Actinomycetota bacterium]|jgi:putative serine protease PepD|nr:Peptidase [Actinomycetota bacterium]
MSDQFPPQGAAPFPPPPSAEPSYGASEPSYGASDLSFGAEATASPGPAPAPVVVTRRRGPGVLGTVLIAALVAAVVGAFAGLAGYLVGRSVDDASGVPDAAVILPQSTSGGVERPAGSISAIAAGTLPAVVSILAEGTTQSGSGSGFVVRPNGYILTNNHVVDLVSDGGTLTVVFSDGDRATGTVVGTNSSYDLAVVKVDRRGLPTVALGDSDDVQVGDTAIAIGAPLGLDGTVTSGIISAIDRPVTAGESESDLAYINAIQTDAAINPGNSGGPLLDGAGNVVGVNSAIASLAVGGEAGNIGLGFAIPINSAKRIAEELIATGSSRTPLMGVQLVMDYMDGGAKVKSVNDSSPALEAGLEADDIITAVNGRSIDDAVELVVEVRNHAPGERLEITYERDGQERTTTLVLADDGAAE